MDFGTLLHQAQRNERNAKKPANYYRTTFDPPKKESKSSKSLSANIQKFLERREQEERRKVVEAKKKRDELLALRSQDGKAKKRVAAMLKRTKAANKSAIADAVDDDNTAVTLGGPAQCDEDDYGYVSQEATAFYAKLMDKYQSAPPDEPLFPQEKKAVVHDLKSTKDRVKMALLREEEEEMLPRKRKRKHVEKPDATDDQSFAGSDMRDLAPSRDRFEEDRRPAPPPPKPRKAAPPPMDFNELLKIAQKKQFEPVTKVEPKVAAQDEPERPMTKKQREEYLKEMEYRRRKEERDLARQKAEKVRREDGPGKAPRPSEGDERTSRPVNANRIPKLSDRQRNETPQQRIPKLGDPSRQTLDRDPGTAGQKAQQMRIPKLSNGGGGDAGSGPRQKPPRPGGNDEERRPKLNSGREEQNRGGNNNRMPAAARDDERRTTTARPDDRQRTKTDVANDRPLHRKPVGDGQPGRQASAAREAEDRSGKGRTGDLKPRMNGGNPNLSGSLPKHLNGAKVATTTPRDKMEDRGRPTSGAPSERREADGVRVKPGDQKRVNGASADYGKKLQESLQNRFQQRRDDGGRKPDQNPGAARAPPKPSEGGVVRNGGKVSQNYPPPQERRNGAAGRPPVSNGTRPAVSGGGGPSCGGGGQGLERKSLGAKRPVPVGSQSTAGGGDRPRTLEGRPKQFPPEDVRKARPFPPQQDVRPRPFPPQQDVRPRQFPPQDVRKPRPQQDVRRRPKPPPAKRRIIDSEDEYDSELDDFIDDGPDETEDYSRHIKEIFGYDKSRYASIEDDEDECMESNFGQVLREEFVSTKLGIMEDLEDIQKEQEEKRRKAIIKKKKLK